MKIAIIGKINPTYSIIEEILSSEFNAVISYFTYREVGDYTKEIDLNSFKLVIFDLNTVTSTHDKAPSKIKTIAQQFEELPILVIHSYNQEKLINPLKEAGAKGLIPNPPTEDIITKAVKHLLDGQEFIQYPSQN